MRAGCVEYDDTLSESLEGSRVSRNPAKPGSVISRKWARNGTDFVDSEVPTAPFSEPPSMENPSSERVRPPRAWTAETTGSKTSEFFSTGRMLDRRFELVVSVVEVGFGDNDNAGASTVPGPKDDRLPVLLWRVVAPRGIPSPVVAVVMVVSGIFVLNSVVTGDGISEGAEEGGPEDESGAGDLPEFARERTLL